MGIFRPLRHIPPPPHSTPPLPTHQQKPGSACDALYLVARDKRGCTLEYFKKYPFTHINQNIQAWVIGLSLQIVLLTIGLQSQRPVDLGLVFFLFSKQATEKLDLWLNGSDHFSFRFSAVDTAIRYRYVPLRNVLPTTLHFALTCCFVGMLKARLQSYMLCPCHRVKSVTDVNRSYTRFFAKCATNVRYSCGY